MSETKMILDVVEQMYICLVIQSQRLLCLFLT